MPRPNEHVCDIKSYKEFARVRREPEDHDSPMNVGGKRVYRLFGFGEGEDGGGIAAYYFPRKQGWGEATDTAQSWCSEHGGTFHAMTGEKAAIMYLTEGAAISMVEAAVSAEGGTIWHELIPIGQFAHPEYGEFNVTDETLGAMIEAFNKGMPVSAGIPIDERGDHSMRADGAYGWIRQLEVRDNCLWGEIEWTPDGIEAVSSGRFKYISPRFFVGEDNFIKSAALCTRPFFDQQPELQVAASDYVEVTGADDGREAKRAAAAKRSKTYGIEVREDGNLAPPKEYQAACPNATDYGDPVNYMYPLKPDARLRNALARMAQSYEKYKKASSRRIVWTRIVRRAKGQGIKHDFGGPLDKLLPSDLRNWAKKSSGIQATGGRQTMPITEVQARAKYVEVKGDVTDEEWVEVSEGMTDDWDSFVASLQDTGDKAVTGDDVAVLEKKLADTQTEAEELKTQLAAAKEKETQAVAAVSDLAKRVEQMEQERKGAEVKAEVTATRFGDERYADTAIEVLTALQMGDDGAIKALQGHLQENKGQLAKVPMGETVQVSAITGKGEEDDETWFANHPMLDDTRNRVKEVAAAKGINKKDAYKTVLDLRQERRR